MENKSHWVYDYLHKAYTKHHKVDNIIVKQESSENKMKSKFPEKKYSHSLKNDANEFKKKQVTFDQAKSYVFEPNSVTNETQKIISIDIKDDNEKNLENEFKIIDKTIEEIKQVSDILIISGSIDIDEIRKSVFDQIGNIDNRIQKIREVLTKNY
jgi:hypothetical protein